MAVDLYKQRGGNVNQPRDLYAAAGMNPNASMKQPLSYTNRQLQPQEVTSNPTAFPGFNKLSQKEQLERIKLSQFDPANQTPTGTFVHGGTYESLPSVAAGAAQSLVNYPIKIANLIKQKPISEFNFAPNNREAGAGETIGDILSFFMPGEAVNLGIKGASHIPVIGKGVNALNNAVQGNKWLRGIANILRGAGETGTFAATKNPENAKESGTEGSLLGGGIQTGINLLTTQNPLIRTLARLGIGTGVGYSVGHPYYGALAGVGLPEASKLVGLGGKNSIAREALEGLTLKDVMRAKLANDRLGTTITPAQASGNYVTSGTEGLWKKSPQGAQYAYRQEQLQNRQQKNSINNMLDNIYQPTKKNELEITNLYNKAHGVNLSNNDLKQIKQNPLWNAALSEAKKDPSLVAKLQDKGIAFKPKYKDMTEVDAAIDKQILKATNEGDYLKAQQITNDRQSIAKEMIKQKTINENNYHFLDEAKTKMDDMYQKAVNQGNTSQAYRINKQREKYLEKLDKLNPDYEKARDAAHPKMVRKEIEQKFNKNEEDFTGKNFYSKFLNSKKSYEDLLRNTKNFPQAQAAIKEMRQGWKHLSNIKTVSQAEAQGKTGLDQARDFWKATISAIKKLAGAKQDVNALKFIYSHDWDDYFDAIMLIQNKADRNRELATLISKVATANGIEMNEK